MSSENFYSELPVLADFAATSNFSNYAKLPQDWQIVAADVEDSTAAIASGQYKAVNIIGVSIITSVLNIARPLIIPSVFGGDGASLCIPEKLANDVAAALTEIKELAQAQYKLKLRVGIIPLQVITAAGYKVLVARHQVSKQYIQAAFAGGGIEYAESLLKDETQGAAYRLHKKGPVAMADFTGLECRWDNVPSKHGETISLIVKALARSIEQEAQIYNTVNAKIEAIYGTDDECSPIYSGGLQLALANRQLLFETRLKTFSKSNLSRIGYFFKIRLEVILGIIFMRYGIKTGETDWGRYKQDVVSSTDCKKFDGSLRQVLSGNTEQRLQLAAYLESRHKRGECVYGIHVANSALVTCLINNRADDHYHFVDGANGGYAAAATAMKKQLRKIAATESEQK